MEQKIGGKIDGYYFGKTMDCSCNESSQYYHSNFEICYIKEGDCRFFIDDRSFDTRAGDLIFIPKGIVHLTDYNDSQSDCIFINFTEDYIPSDIHRELIDSKYLYRLGEIAENIEELFSKIEREYNDPDEYTKSILSCYTAEMLYVILRYPGDPEKATTGNELIDSIIGYIQQNYMSDIKLSAVAKIKSISAEHLSRTFKSCTGFGFNEYLTLLRLRKAEEMIRTEPDKTISEIAYECGFNDGNYFSYKFKKMYGVSPIKLRNNIP